MNKKETLALWGEPQPVLGEGHVRLVDYMGDDAAIPQAARVSYGEGTQLIRFLMRHEHFSPFAMCQVKFHVRLPIYVHNQWVRHDRFHWNVMSGRYSEMPEECWTPQPQDIRGQGVGNKQVANGGLDEDAQRVAHNMIGKTYHVIRRAYECMLDDGVGREQARTVLPMGQYTEAYVTANLGDWMLFLRQRMDPHAQYEIRVYAMKVYEILLQLFPVTMQAFMDYQVNSVRLSAQEWAATQNALGSFVEDLTEEPEQRKNFLSKFIPTKRERQEFWKKIRGY